MSRNYERCCLDFCCSCRGIGSCFCIKKDVLPFVKLYIIALNNMLCLCLWWMCRWVINGDLYFRLAVSIELWLNYNFLSEMEGIILVRCKCFILNMFSYILKCKLYQVLIFSQGLKQFKIVLSRVSMLICYNTILIFS